MKEQVMEGVKDLRNYFKQKHSTSKPALVPSGTNEVSQAELAKERLSSLENSTIKISLKSVRK